MVSNTTYFQSCPGILHIHFHKLENSHKYKTYKIRFYMVKKSRNIYSKNAVHQKCTTPIKWNDPLGGKITVRLKDSSDQNIMNMTNVRCSTQSASIQCAINLQYILVGMQRYFGRHAHVIFAMVQGIVI